MTGRIEGRPADQTKLRLMWQVHPSTPFFLLKQPRRFDRFMNLKEVY